MAGDRNEWSLRSTILGLSPAEMDMIPSMIMPFSSASSRERMVSLPAMGRAMRFAMTAP